MSAIYHSSAGATLTLTHEWKQGIAGQSIRQGGYYVRIFEGPGRIPVVLGEEIPAESDIRVPYPEILSFLAAEIIAKAFPQRLDKGSEEPAVLWIEHRPESPIAQYWRVDFSAYTPFVGRWDGSEQMRIGTANYVPITPDMVQSLLNLPQNDVHTS
jgi:hypothetical protein